MGCAQGMQQRTASREKKVQELESLQETLSPLLEFPQL